MADFSGLDARTAIIQFYGANSADHPNLAAIIAKPDLLGGIIEATEYLYARRADLDAAGVELLGDLARFISGNNFWGKGERMGLITGVAARIAGGGAAQLSSDPEVEAQFAAQDEPAAPEPVTENQEE
jgi:hypothetical protein